MTNDERDIQRKLKLLRHAEKIGNVRKACRYFGVGRSSFYRWRDAYRKSGEAGLKNAKSIPKNPANQTPSEIVDKVLYLRRKYHLGPIRIVWYLARYHGIKISDAGVYRIPRGTRMRKLHTKRYQKQVPGHHIQVDVKFLTLKGKSGQKVRRFQYTAIDDATRVRALKVYEKHTQQTLSTSLITSSRNSRSVFGKYAQITVTNSRLSSIGMSRISGLGTLTSNAERHSSTEKLNAHIVQTSRNSISF